MDFEELKLKLFEKHGTALSDRDPILMFPTILEYVFEQSNQTHAEALEQLKSELVW
ncbi:transcriptional activator TraM [Pseudomonas duriflava]|uniref:Transcriptional activator TraM n=1 Tax=Pseudomonas duriflava TaxID=459528 RepID=A0A562PHK8_9PSED|nr:hypothetical protein [Pseudomonas duriflava]TWI43909.1 transcriptional activator TraM [Pseudomonas duriflava]